MGRRLTGAAHTLYDRCADAKKNKRTYYAIYTVVFAILALLIFFWYWRDGRTLIWATDGWKQHYKALIYYAKYLRQIARTLISQHRLVIPAWDFTIGEGADILNTFHYYVIGDPFSVLSVLVPTKYMWAYYDLMILLRLYLAGIAFSELCFYKKHANGIAVLAGAQSYVFCYWAVLNAARHCFFLNPLLYLPLIILGLEKIFDRERPYLYVCTIAVAALSNFYFFYMLAWVTAIYAIVRAITLYGRNVKAILGMIGRIAVLSVLATALAAIIFLPACNSFLGSSRVMSGRTFHWLYPLYYYSQVPGLLLTEGSTYWLCMGFAAPVLPAVILLFYRRGKDRGRSALKCFLLIALVIILIPFLGQVLNGFSYRANRWCWALALLTSYVLVKIWPELMTVSRREGKILFAGVSAYALLCLVLTYSRTAKTFIGIAIALIFLILIFPLDREHGAATAFKQIMALVLVMISLFASSYWKNGYTGEDYASEAVDVRTAQEDLFVNQSAALESVIAENVDTGYILCSGRGMEQNANLFSGYASTDFYWSINNPYIAEFRSDLELMEVLAHSYQGYDDRTFLNEVAGVKYFVTQRWSKTPVPYGFSEEITFDAGTARYLRYLEQEEQELGAGKLTEAQKEVLGTAAKQAYIVYRNDYALPLCRMANSYLPESQWLALPAVEKQEALLQTVVLSEDTDAVPAAAPAFTAAAIPYELEYDETAVSLQDYGFVVTEDQAKVTIRFEGLADSETYLSIAGFEFEGVPEYDLYRGEDRVDPLQLYNRANWDLLPSGERARIRQEKKYWSYPDKVIITVSSSAKVSKTLQLFTEENSWYNGRQDFTINLNHTEEPVVEITLKLPRRGVYSFDSLTVWCQPMGGYAQTAAALQERGLGGFALGNDSFFGTVSYDEPGLLFVAIPYSEGWEARVDGEQVPILRADVMYMAVEMPAGDHQVTFRYETPLLREGAAVSLGATALFLVLILVSERRRKTTEPPHKNDRSAEKKRKRARPLYGRARHVYVRNDLYLSYCTFGSFVRKAASSSSVGM